MKSLYVSLIAGCLFLNALIFPLPSFAQDSADHIPGISYRYIDQYGRVITISSRKPVKGDEIITEKGYHYKVIKVISKTAQVSLLGKDKSYLALLDYYTHTKTIPAVTQQKYNRPIGIYHTHSDESYLPTDGASSIPYKGGIFQVGDILQNSLEDKKLNVIFDKTPHDPHDANAYYRSRRTAAKLLKQNPVAIFDVHRDGIDDPSFYRRIVSKQDVTQLRLVIGRQNPKMSSNMDFAKRLMAFANKKNPGLIKEIYIANGNYNQDLLSTALLIEAGTYTNEKSEAESGIALLANSVPTVLGLNPPAKGINSSKATRQGWKTAIFIIALVMLAAIAFIFINNPGIKIKEYLLQKFKRISGHK